MMVYVIDRDAVGRVTTCWSSLPDSGLVKPPRPGRRRAVYAHSSMPEPEDCDRRRVLYGGPIYHSKVDRDRAMLAALIERTGTLIYASCQLCIDGLLPDGGDCVCAAASASEDATRG